MAKKKKGGWTPSWEQEEEDVWESIFVGTPSPKPKAKPHPWSGSPYGSSWKKPKPFVRPKSAGGVVIDKRGRVLLRQPTNFFGGYKWNFPKGRLDPGENAAKAAVREIWEETGYKVKVLAKLPGEWKGSVTEGTYFLCAPIAKEFDIVPGGKEPDPGWESQAIVWANLSKAAQLLQENPKGKQLRDMTLLAIAYGEWLKRQKKAK